jgi:hypothetical protein
MVDLLTIEQAKNDPVARAMLDRMVEQMLLPKRSGNTVQRTCSPDSNTHELAVQR